MLKNVLFIHTLPSELVSDMNTGFSCQLGLTLSPELGDDGVLSSVHSPKGTEIQRDRETKRQRDRGGLTADPHSSQYKPLCASVFAWGGLCLLKNAGHTINVRLKLTHTHKSGHRVNNCS